MLRSDLCDFRDVYIVVKGVIAVSNPDDAKKIIIIIKQWHLKTMHHLSTQFQKLMVHKLTKQKT